MPTRVSIWFVNATQHYSDLPMVCRQAQAAGQPIHVLYRGRDREAILHQVSPGHEFIRLIELADDGFDFPGLAVENDAEIFFLPCAERSDWTELRQRAPLDYPHCLEPLAAAAPGVDLRHYRTSPFGAFGWRA